MLSFTTQTVSAAEKAKASDSQQTSNIKKSSAYDVNFRRYMMDRGMYTFNPTDRVSIAPANEATLKAILQHPQDLSSSPEITQKVYQQYLKKQNDAFSHADVMSKVLPILLGDFSNYSYSKNCTVNNPKPVTKPLGNTDIATLQPDHYDGLAVSEVPLKIRMALSRYIESHKSKMRPCLPNFLLEAKGKNQSVPQGQLQALHDGVVGERAMMKIARYAKQASYDSAHTISAVYHAGAAIVEIPSTHAIQAEHRVEADLALQELPWTSDSTRFGLE